MTGDIVLRKMNVKSKHKFLCLETYHFFYYCSISTRPKIRSRQMITEFVVRLYSDGGRGAYYVDMQIIVDPRFEEAKIVLDKGAPSRDSGSTVTLGKNLSEWNTKGSRMVCSWVHDMTGVICKGKNRLEEGMQLVRTFASIVVLTELYIC